MVLQIMNIEFCGRCGIDGDGMVGRDGARYP